jgi:hypothetical protein
MRRKIPEYLAQGSSDRSGVTNVLLRQEPDDDEDDGEKDDDDDGDEDEGFSSLPSTFWQAFLKSISQ